MCGLTIVATLAALAPLAHAQDKSLRQEREEKRKQLIHQVENKGQCIGYFDVNGDAAEVLELRSGLPKQDVRAFVERLADYGRAFNQLAIGYGLICEGDKQCIEAVVDANERGVKKGLTESRGAAVGSVLTRFKECALVLGLARAEYFEAPTPFKLTLLPSSKIKISEADVDALQRKIQPCFKLPPNIKKEPVDLNVYLDGRFRVDSIYHDIHRPDGPDAELWQAVARAVSNPDCQPLNVTALNYRGGTFVLSLQFVPLQANSSPPPKPEEKKIEERPKPVEDKIVLKPREPEPPMGDKPSEPQAAMAPNLATVLTAREIEAVRQKLRPCWQLPKAVAQDASLLVTVTVQLKPDGRPTSAVITNQERYSRDPLFRVAADAARRAVLNPSCQPWPLAPEKYFTWRAVTLSFDPANY
jgi:hypothetical protein